MCGIVGILGKSDVSEDVLAGLTRLEYRGYDSSGIATVEGGRLQRRRAVGKLKALREVLSADPLPGMVGIGHTRWATHGAPTVENAHPHATARIAVVHNGIIENFADLREELQAKGINFATQTDTEVIPQLISFYLEQENLDLVAAFSAALKRLEGAFAIAAVMEGEEDLILCARRGSPLALGGGEGMSFLGSDAYALAPFTNRVTYLQEGDWAVVRREGWQIFDADDQPVEREEQISDASSALVDKGGHRHFMAKEVHEQPEVIGHTLAAYIDPIGRKVCLPEPEFDFANLERLTISACGTAYYAGVIAKYWFEDWAGLAVEIDIASELRYRSMPWPGQNGPGKNGSKKGAALFISQSGETADTLAALREAKKHGQKIAAVVNVPESTISREADALFPTHAGPEIGVASTKAFTCQLATLACLALSAGVQRGRIDEASLAERVDHLLEIPRLVAEAMKAEQEIEVIAAEIAKARDVLYLGRGLAFPLAMEGALKLKEISYIHAEGYAAGELKHGPIALIDEDVPVIVIAPEDDLFEKTVSNMHEVMARGGKCLLLSSKNGIKRAEAGGALWGSVAVPDCDPALSPLVYSVPVQLLAYYTALAKGTDVDQPRNLAKSVTVE
jgi:glutamine---fructose-6-phosphate transaminase (isomerizing)